MKSAVKLMGLLTLALLPSIASAQQGTTRSVSVGASGGLSLPMGDFGDRAESGYSVAGHIFLAPATMSRLTFRGDVSYDAWQLKSSNAIVDRDVNTLGIAGNAMLYIGERGSAMRPYLLAGGGAYRFKGTQTVGSLTQTQTDTKPGVQGGIGFDFNLSGFSTFLEAKYVNVFTDNTSTSYVPITFGVRF